MINERQLTAVVMGLVAGIAGGMFVFWFRTEPLLKVEKRLAERPRTSDSSNSGASNAQPKLAAPREVVDLRGTFERLEGHPGDSTAIWPRFRGENFSNISEENLALAEEWAEGGPPLLWAVPLSEGHSGAAVWKGAVYVMDYDEKLESDVLLCLSLADGQGIWRRSYRAPTKRNHGVSRTVPAVTEDFVVTMGPRCHVVCVDRATGGFRWGLDLAGDHGAQVPLWYTGQCPLIDEGVAVLAPCGDKALLMGVECATGQVLWATPNVDGWKMSHSSIILMNLLGRRMYVYCALGGVVGVSAEGSDRGQVLWKSSEWQHSVLAPSPVAVDEGRVFLTAGYGGGSAMLGLTRAEGTLRAEILYRLEKTVFSCEQHTPVLYEGYLFGILPKDAAELRGQAACLSLDGKLRWTSGKTERFGLGPFLLADGKIFILNDNGELTLIRASTKGFERLARARVLQGRDAWAPMALVEGKLLLRDSERMICLDVRRHSR